MNKITDIHPVHKADFVTGIIGTDPVLDSDMPHVAFVGRSNVGKSSLINFMVGRNSLVRSSSRPGKTTEINFFNIDDEYFFVDLPGYGFARMGEKQREKLRKLILWYLMYTEILKRKTFIVLDAQVGVTDFDADIIAELAQSGEDAYVVLNKIDKLNQKERHKIEETTKQQVPFRVLSVSSLKKRGKQSLWDAILS